MASPSPSHSTKLMASPSPSPSTDLDLYLDLVLGLGLVPTLDCNHTVDMIYFLSLFTYSSHEARVERIVFRQNYKKHSCFKEQFHFKNFENGIIFDFDEIEICFSYQCCRSVYEISELKIEINVLF